MSREILFTLLSLLIAYVSYRVIKFINFTYYYQLKLVEDVPGPECLPIIGCLHKMPKNIKDIPEFLSKYALEAINKGSSMMKFWVLTFAVILPLDHNSVKGILYSNELDKGKDYKFFEQWLGPGLLLGSGERWFKARKLATPAFHFSKLEEYAEIIDFHCRTLVDILNKKADGKEIDLYNYIKLCALDIIADTTMGVQLDAQHNSDQPYVRAVEEFNTLTCYRTLRIYLRPKFIWWLLGYSKKTDAAVKTLHSFTNKVIQERLAVYNEERQTLDGSSKVHLNFLDMMLQLKDSEHLSMQHLREEVDTIIFAGHDTTSHAVSWAIWCFATHPEIQERVYEEIIEHFGHSDSEFCTVKMKELKYFDQCFKEVLRLFPPVPAIQRRIFNKIEMDGRMIPEYTHITIPIILIHRNPKIFENSLKFDPDRFAEDKEYPPLSFIPFSAGQRNCVGQKFAQLEAKLILAHLLFHFKIESDHKMEDNGILFEVVLRPEIGIPVKLTKRNH